MKYEASQGVLQCTYCPPSESLCQFNCTSGNDESKRNCQAFDDDGKCKVCPGKCAWHKHIVSNTYYKPTEVEATVVLEDKKAKHFEKLETRTKEITSNSNELIDDCNKFVKHHHRI